MELVFHISGCAVDNRVKFATCTLLGAALPRWNGHVKTLGHDAAYAMTWGILKKKLTDKYCLKGEIKKLKIELWNHMVRGNAIAAYTQRFLELTLMCTRFLADETEKVDKYISGIPDNIHGNVMSARPKTLDEAIELELPQQLIQVHNIFHISNLKKCLSDESLLIPLDELYVDDKPYFVEEPMEIMDCEIKQMRRSRIPIIKVRWNSKRGTEFTWEREDQFKKTYRHLFTKSVPSSRNSS
nr:putative reverse transcriptase domain-containing protein [Tanacetum cinerariifolium]